MKISESVTEIFYLIFRKMKNKQLINPILMMNRVERIVYVKKMKRRGHLWIQGSGNFAILIIL